jgi:hypothetical protein
MVEHGNHTRLVPLDSWERMFIKNLVNEALTEALHVPEEDAAKTLRLLDLLKKVDPVYPPWRDEDGNVVEMRA